MRSIVSVLTAATSLAIGGLLAAGGAQAAQRSQYGGILRIEFHAASASLDPRTWKAGASSFGCEEKLAALVFERLVALDNYGRFQPMLASEWTHDTAYKRWQFTIRHGAKFSDGSTVTAMDVAGALQTLLPTGRQITALGNVVVIQTGTPMPDLLAELASGRNFIFRAEGNGTLLGTGLFFAAALKAAVHEAPGGSSSGADARATRLRFVANEEAWSGRPLVNEIEVALGVPFLRQLLDLQLGRADIIELSPELVRRATQENLRVWTSAPLTLLALRFTNAQPAAANKELREALSLAVDRGTMAGVLLQKQAEPASALLPQWLSGYAFLFGMETNLERAKEIRRGLPGNVAGGSEPLRLHVDAAGDLPKLLGERVVVNARQAQIVMQIASRTPNRSTGSAAAIPGEPEAGVHLLAWRYSSLSPREELESLLRALVPAEEAEISADPEQIYIREHALEEERLLVPLVALPEFAGIAANVRDWLPTRWGEWNLADVWLEPADAAASGARSAKPDEATISVPVSGAKP